jgi:hypothetical protein
LSIIKFVYNNSYYALVKALSFYLIYNYHSKIHYEVKNNFIEKKILLTQERVKQLYNLKKILAKRLKNVVAQQAKYYNKKHRSKSFAIKELIMLSIKNLKQKRFSKKMSHKYVESFRIKNKSRTQAYCFILLNIYRIYNTFYVLLLKLYLYCVDNK